MTFSPTRPLHRFQSTPSARRATFSRSYRSTYSQFQSTPSARRATVFIGIHRTGHGISIHALREEGDSKDGTIAGGAKNFNPRPPRGGRPKQQNYFIPRQVFQSTPSARRATLSSAAKPRRASNFNPRPPRGGRRTAAGPRGRAAKNFNPRPPRGGRPR